MWCFALTSHTGACARPTRTTKIVLAVPVAPEGALEELREGVDEIICLSTPSPFLAVGAHYAEFGQLADADVISLLEERHRRMARAEIAQLDETGVSDFGRLLEQKCLACSRRRECSRHSNDH